MLRFKVGDRVYSATFRNKGKVFFVEDCKKKIEGCCMGKTLWERIVEKIRRLLCRIFGHNPAQPWSSEMGLHAVCTRCNVILTWKAKEGTQWQKLLWSKYKRLRGD